MRISQRGDSGTHQRIMNTSTIGERPTRKRPRQPMTGSNVAAMMPASRLPPGSKVVIKALTQPRLWAGMNSCTSGRSIVKIPALPIPRKNRKNIRKSQPGTKPSGPGGSTIMPVASEDVGGADQLPLVGGQLLLGFEAFDHASSRSGRGAWIGPSQPKLKLSLVPLLF